MGTATRLATAPSPFPNSCEVSLGPFCSNWGEPAGLGLDSKVSKLPPASIGCFFFLKPKVKFTCLLRTAGEQCSVQVWPGLQGSLTSFPGDFPVQSPGLIFPMLKMSAVFIHSLKSITFWVCPWAFLQDLSKKLLCSLAVHGEA